MHRLVTLDLLDPGATRVEIAVHPNRSSEPSRLLQVAFFILMLSLAFDAIRIGGPLVDTKSAFGPSRLAGYFFLLVSLVDFRSAFSRVPKELLLYGIYAGFGVIASLPYLAQGGTSGIMTIPQNLVLFWIASNLLRSRSGWRVFVIGLLCSVGLIAAAQFTGFGVSESDVVQHYVVGVGMADRSSALGEDPNFSAAYRALGVVVGLMILLRSGGQWGMRVVGGGMAALAAISIVSTGSRGGLLALGVGVLSLTMFQRSLKARIIAFGVGALILSTVVYLVASSVLFADRIASSIESGDTADRTTIWLAAIKLIPDSPFYGYGLPTYQLILGDALGEAPKATHNILLAALLGSGVLGLIAFAAASVRIAWRCYRQRAVAESAIALALLVTAFAAGMSLNVEFKKWFWLILAAACARSVLGKLQDSKSAVTQKEYA
jgi:hypothetical protein